MQLSTKMCERERSNSLRNKNKDKAAPTLGLSPSKRTRLNSYRLHGIPRAILAKVDFQEIHPIFTRKCVSKKRKKKLLPLIIHVTHLSMALPAHAHWSSDEWQQPSKIPWEFDSSHPPHRQTWQAKFIQSSSRFRLPIYHHLPVSDRTSSPILPSCTFVFLQTVGKWQLAATTGNVKQLRKDAPMNSEKLPGWIQITRDTLAIEVQSKCLKFPASLQPNCSHGVAYSYFQPFQQSAAPMAVDSAKDFKAQQWIYLVH